jgi:predicted O-methyltransferase YrrM
VGSRFLNNDTTRSKIIQLFGDTARFDFSPYFGKMDMVFIDGAHTYEYLLNDTKIARKLLKDKGVILWHDYAGDWPGVTKALNKLYIENPGINLRHIEGTCLLCLLLR